MTVESPTPITMANINTCSLQQIFDWIVYRARKQMRKSTLSEESLAKIRPGLEFSVSELSSFCAYRGDHGCACFAGFCIDDSEYKPEFENLTARRVFTDLNGSRLNLLIDMQAIHDDLIPSRWEPAFREVAKSHHCTYTPRSS